jgi:hypothetical protein
MVWFGYCNAFIEFDSCEKEKKEEDTEIIVKLKPITSVELIIISYVIQVYIRKTDSSVDPGLPTG